MTVGDKIKKIRTFRGMTQKELGLAIGFEEKGADNRIAQYETNYRVPKTGTAGQDGRGAAGRPPELLHHRPRLCRGLHADILLAGRGQPWRYPPVPTCPQSGQEQGPLMIPLYGTMIAMTGPHTLPWVCTSSMALWTSSCGNGFFVSRSYTPGRSPGKSILNGNSTGRHTCDDGLEQSDILYPLAEK